MTVCHADLRQCPGVDLEEEPAGHEKGPKVRGMTDAKLAKKLRAELQAMLAQPLRQRINSKFFTGGTSQAVAKSLAAAARPADEAGVGGEEKTEGAVVDAAAMQASLAEAQRLVQNRAAGTSGKKKRKQRQMSLAEHQAAALKSAVAAKRMKKARKAMAGQGTREEGGVMALAAIRAARAGVL